MIIDHAVRHNSLKMIPSRIPCRCKMIKIRHCGLQEECLWSDPVFVTFTSNRTFCAGLLDGSGPCNGDSGSGLVLFDAATNRYQLRGIVSRSVLGIVQSCNLKKYVVYVDVAKYVTWIQEQISVT